MSNRIKQFSVVECVSRVGHKAMPTGNKLNFFAHTAKECAGKVADWLAERQKGWKAAKTKPSVRRGSVVWQVAEGYTVP